MFTRHSACCLWHCACKSSGRCMTEHTLSRIIDYTPDWILSWEISDQFLRDFGFFTVCCFIMCCRGHSMSQEEVHTNCSRVPLVGPHYTRHSRTSSHTPCTALPPGQRNRTCFLGTQWRTSGSLSPCRPSYWFQWSWCSTGRGTTPPCRPVPVDNSSPICHRAGGMGRRSEDLYCSWSRTCNNQSRQI